MAEHEINLVLDAGNTFLKTGLFLRGELVHHARFPSGDIVRVPLLVTDIAKKHHAEIASVILSSVTDIDDNDLRFFRENRRFIRLHAGTPLPFRNEYLTPGTLGYDRIAAVSGAVALYPGKDLLTVDAGTCITYDFISKDKVYKGGSISPGIGMRFMALNRFTKQLPHVTPAMETPLTGQDTEGSIRSGVINGIRAEFDGIAEAYKALYPSMLTVVTGGDMKYFVRKAKSDIFANSNLVLTGLNHILEYNAENH